MIRIILAVLAMAVPALAADKPIVVYARGPECDELCLHFEAAVRHPAMQRRLVAVEFQDVDTREGEKPYLAVRTPSGREAMRWYSRANWVMLSDILSLVEAATPHLESAASNDPATAERGWPLVILALGELDRGRLALESMLTSQFPENRGLAAIWLERLRPAPSEELLAQHAKSGTTDRVRFEAWMALGDVRVRKGAYEQAIEAYDRAAEIDTGSAISRRNALSARQHAAARATPVAGLGAPGAVIAGRRTITPRGLPKDAASVEFLLDGRVAARAKKAPFAAPVQFGRIPSRRVLQVVAKNAAGKVVSRASMIVNERSEAFAVDIVEPATHELSGAVNVAVAARVPSSRSVDHVLLEWNGKRVARFTAPPYRTRVTVKEGESGVLRAVLRLDDGSETEDVLLANTGAMLFETGAHLVEVPAYFGGANPAASNVLVKEAGKARTVEQIIAPQDAPLRLALLVDASNSMTEHMLDVQEAAARFVAENVDPRDKTMVVSFDSSARIVAPWTNDRKAVENAILRLTPGGGTALYDALITALLQLQASGSRKAIVVFSDGIDVSSVFSSGDAAEVARRAGVPIYVLALTPGQADVMKAGFAKNELLALSKRTGGKGFEMKSLESLGKLFAEIGADLRTQSLVIYRTDSAGTEWRPLELSVKGGGQVRAPSGVYVTAKENR